MSGGAHLPISGACKVLDTCSNVTDGENHCKDNGAEQNAEARGTLDQLEGAGAIALPNDMEECHASEDPPRIPSQMLVSSCEAHQSI
jgi:hypothetical protein